MWQKPSKGGFLRCRGRFAMVSPVAAIMPPSGRNSTYPTCPVFPSLLSFSLSGRSDIPATVGRGKEAAIEIAVPGQPEIRSMFAHCISSGRAIFRQQRVGNAVGKAAIRCVIHLHELEWKMRGQQINYGTRAAIACVRERAAHETAAEQRKGSLNAFALNTSQECTNYFRNAEYASVWAKQTLTSVLGVLVLVLATFRGADRLRNSHC